MCRNVGGYADNIRASRFALPPPILTSFGTWYLVLGTILTYRKKDCFASSVFSVEAMRQWGK